MVCIYALIFDVHTEKGDKFLTMEDVLKEYQQSEQDYNGILQIFE